MQLPSISPARLVVAATAVLSAVSFAGCAASQSSLQDETKKALTNAGFTVNSGPNCPSNVQVKTGNKFTCTANVSKDGKTQDIEIHAHIASGNTFDIDEVAPVGGGTPSTPATTTT
jgi:hypothetical protein